MTAARASVPPAGTLPPEPPRRVFRADVEGLRAVAVLAVLAYHAGVPGFGGGFVGVDVFFVLSGFLITGLLVEERAGTGRVSLVRFYARRARRLLPAATLVLFVGLAGVAAFGTPLALEEAADDARAVATFTANLDFADDVAGYFADERPSPFQHYWSLAVEEQFYVAWPALVVLATLGARHRAAVRRRLVLLLAVVVPVSFALCVARTGTDPQGAFYLLPTRAWELGVGAVVALLPLRLGRRSATVLAGAGAALVLGAVVGTDTRPFPGWAAAVPVLGTALVVLAGTSQPTTVVATGLGRRLLQRIGAYSYSLYLWHWMALVVAALARPGIVGSWQKSAVVVAASAVPAIASYHLLEHPLRSSSWLLALPRRSIAMGAGLLALGVAAGGATLAVVDLDAGRPAGASSVATDHVPSDLRPSLRDATADISPLYDRPGCDNHEQAVETGPCVFGDPDGRTRVVLFGDSHAGQWFTAVERLAVAEGWRLEVEVTPGCTALLHQTTERCGAWRDAVLDDLLADPPEAVVLIDSGRRIFDRDEAAWRSATERTLRLLEGATHVVLLGENHRPPTHAAACLSENVDDVRPCEPDPGDDTHRRIVAQARQLASEAGASFVDLTPFQCRAGRCPAVVGDVLVYRDDDHLTETFVRRVAGPVGAAIRAGGEAA